MPTGTDSPTAFRLNGANGHAAPPRRSSDDWVALRTFHLYRCAVAAALFGLFATGFHDNVFDLRWPGLFGLVCIIYLLHCLPCAVAISRRWLKVTLLTQAFVGADIAAVAGLFLSTAGVQEGLGVLLIAPVAATGLLLSRRLAAFNAAAASMAVLVSEFMRHLLQQTDAEYLQAGLLGTLFFLVSLTAFALASRSRAHAALAEERKGELDDLSALNERIIQQVQVGLMVLDNESRVRMLNQAARKMLGIGPDALDSRLMSSSPQLAWALEAWKLSPTLPPEPMGTGPRLILPKFSRLGSGEHSPVLVFLEDARRAGEQAQQMKLASLGRLTASIAHEIRNPLSAISHAGQLLEESEHLDNADRRMLNIVHRHTRRIDDIIKGILGLSRRGDTVAQHLNLAEWLPAVVEDYAQGKRGALAIDFSAIPADFSVLMDPNHLQQILYNLWDNADRHARLDDRELRIEMVAGTEDDTDYLIVADNGPGIRGAAASSVMEPFYTTRNDGTGLGLYIVQGLCECNNVSLDLVPPGEGLPKAGAQFRLLFLAPGESVPQPEFTDMAAPSQ